MFKVYFRVLFAITIIIAFGNSASAQFAGGTGTTGDPYQISTAVQLDSVRNYLDQHFILNSDIDLNVSPYNSGSGWEPIGSGFSDSFTGTFDGNDKNITGLFIDRSSSYTGLFGYIKTESDTAKVIDLSITDANVTGGSFTAILSGYLRAAKISDITVSGSASGSGNIVGGVIGGAVLDSYLDNVTSETTVSGVSYLGGIIGNSNASDIEYSEFEGEIINTSSGNRIGGIAGQLTDADVNYSSSVMTVKSLVNIEDMGGIAGYVTTVNGPNSGISYCEARIKFGNTDLSENGVIGESGGIVGELNWGSVVESFATGFIISLNSGLSSKDLNGGIVGINGSNGSITKTYASVAIFNPSGTGANSGGLVGDNSGNVTSSYWEKVKRFPVPAIVSIFNMSNFYYDIEEPIGRGTGVGTGATGLTTNEMLQDSSFSGFDFEGVDQVWDIYKGYSFPFLKGVGSHTSNIASVSGAEGWRMFAVPVDSITYEQFLDSLWTQGYTGADSESGTSNVYTWDEATQSWSSISSATDKIARGTGILVYVYDDVDYDQSGDGFPKRLIAQGVQSFNDESIDLTLTNSGASDTYVDSDDGWNFIGNPFAHPISWDAVSGWTKTGLDNSYYVWNNGENSYQSWNGSTGTLPSDDLIAPWQGFWVKANDSGAPAITVKSAAKDTSGALLKERVTPSLKFSLKSEEDSDRYKSTSIIALNEQSSFDKDAYDTWKLAPLNSDYLSVFTQDIEGLPFDINSIPYNLEGINMVDLSYDWKLRQISDNNNLILEWDVYQFPKDWQFNLHDKVTGQMVGMKKNASYQFVGEQEVTRSKQSKSFKTPKHSLVSPNVQKTKSLKEARFSVEIIAPNTVSNNLDNDVPNHFGLSQNYPNPFNPNTMISYSLPSPGMTRLSIYNVNGQRVAELVREFKAAGKYSVEWNASNVSSGVYYYRLESSGLSLIRKMTLIK